MRVFGGKGLALAGVLTAAAGAFVWAQSAPESRERTRPRGLQERLGLSDEQMAEVRKMRTAHEKQAIRRRADLRIAHLELRELLDAPTVDEKAVSAKVKELTDLQAAALRARVDGELAMRKMLTPEQARQLQELRGEMRHRLGERWLERRMDRGGRGPRGPRQGPGPDGPAADQGEGDLVDSASAAMTE